MTSAPVSLCQLKIRRKCSPGMCGNRAGRSTTTTATMGSPVRPSCTQENQTDAVFEDAQSEYATSNGSLCKEGTVYYAAANHRLLYYDEATKTSGLLCGRADCSHDDMNCDAYIDSSGAGIQI